MNCHYLCQIGIVNMDVMILQSDFFFFLNVVHKHLPGIFGLFSDSTLSAGISKLLIQPFIVKQCNVNLFTIAIVIISLC